MTTQVTRQTLQQLLGHNQPAFRRPVKFNDAPADLPIGCRHQGIDRDAASRFQVF
jgi:hypothetical protein